MIIPKLRAPTEDKIDYVKDSFHKELEFEECCLLGCYAMWLL
jgi:hypothetical protein